MSSGISQAADRELEDLFSSRNTRRAAFLLGAVNEPRSS